MKKFIKIILLALASLMLVACGTNKENTNTGKTSEEKKTKKVAVIAKGFQHQFWKAVESGTKKAGAEFGLEITFQGPDNESAIAQQVEYLNAAIDLGPDAIAFAALDTKAALDSIKNAQDKKIPIVGFDSGVPDAPSGSVVANAATDNYAAAELAADKLFELIKDKVTNNTKVVRIGVVSQESNSQSIVERTKGFIDKMVKLIGADRTSVEGHASLANKKDGAKVIIDLAIPAEVKDSDAVSVASAILEKDDLIAVYGSNEFTANALITANEGLDKIGKDKVLAIGFDSGSKQLQAVRSGLFVGSITQNPVQIGYQAVKLAYEASEGKKVKDVDTGALWYDASNMDSDEIKACLYE